MKILNSSFQITLLVILLVAMNIGIEKLTDSGLSGAEILFTRSIFNLIAAFFIAIYTKANIVPKHPKLQLGAFICLGLSLLLVFTAYQYISAGSVSTMQRLDIPILVLLAVFSQKVNWLQLVLSVSALIGVALLLYFNQTTDEDPIGYMIVLSAVVVMCINTVIQKRIAIAENIPTIIFISSLSSVFWGGIRCIQTHATFQNLNALTLFTRVILSLINLAIFYLINYVYKNYNPEIVRFPYLLAAFFTMITEMIIEQKIFNPLLLGGNIGILILISLLVKSRLSTNNTTIS